MIKSAFWGTSAISASNIKVVSWNLGSLQTNPFEFWQPQDSSMRQLQSRIDSSISEYHKIPLTIVFTRNMFQDLLPGNSDLYDIIIGDRSAGSLLTDPEIGQKRFVSMPDRVTRALQGLGTRPSVMTGFEGDCESFDQWWRLYLDFMRKGDVFKKVLKEYDEGKYERAGLTEIEKSYYREFQLVMLAAADAVLMQIALAHPGWQTDVKRMNNVFSTKFERVLEILAFHNPDVVCLQEVDVFDYPRFPSDEFHVLTDPVAAGKQTSVVLLRRNIFTSPETISFKADFLADEDLLVVKTQHVKSGRQLTVASFHGDTRGKTTLPTLRLILDKSDGDIIIGMDANTHTMGSDGKLVSHELVKFLKSNAYHISNPNAHPTTRSSRTFVQPQSHKGSHEAQLLVSEEPKDWIAASKSIVISSSGIDFTGRAEEVDDYIPNARFPSDHALVFGEVIIGRRTDEL